MKLFLFTSAVCLALVGLTHHQAPSRRPHRKTNHQAAQKPEQTAQRQATGSMGGQAEAPAAAPASTAATTTASATPAAEKEELTDTKASAEETEAVPTKELGEHIQRLIKANHAGDSAKAREVSQQLAKVAERFTESDELDFTIRDTLQGVEQRLSWVALALLPVFALFVRALYWRRDSYYFEHLVFSLHYHAFLFMFWAAYVLCDAGMAFLPLHNTWNLLLTVGLLTPVWYLYAALRRMYGESRRRAAAKAVVIASLHSVSILLGVLAVGAALLFSIKG